jgi:hypothetical protein
MLLNLSNHPSTHWPKSQTALAIEKYGEIQDLPFPQIDPELSGYDVDKIVEEYEIKIRKINPTAVHIMGELTFTHRLVNQLKVTGVNCIASTTHRKVTEQNGMKTSAFEFVQFRDY